MKDEEKPAWKERAQGFPYIHHLLLSSRPSVVCTRHQRPALQLVQVGSFAGKGLTRLTLWRLPAETGDAAEGSADSAAAESASLEEVVLGYLAAGRGTAGLQLN